MKRALLIVLDSVGIGHAPDAAQFRDEGSDTVGHILENRPDTELPHLDRCGLAGARALAAGLETSSFTDIEPLWAFGAMAEKSVGKDTTTGHWEIAGAPLDEPFATYEKFPPEVVQALEEACGFSFIGNYAQSGTVILEELGKKHIATGKPILYTSADSVMQIAAHEDVIPINELYQICTYARHLCDKLRIGRVIARPFIGMPGAFERTSNRRDFSLVPPRTILNALNERGVPVVSIGKISDIFAGSGISLSHHTKSNAEGMSTIEDVWIDDEFEEDHLVFVNLVDFDMLYGHRRDVAGYARALEAFDSWLGDFLDKIRRFDLVMITADHGNDPTWSGTDHTREQVPLLVHAPGLKGSLGSRESFSDVAATLADWFGLDPWPVGRSVLTGQG
ncbi:MAG: phosphopentomutase [Verrucomicrobiae bacterium]|nr:phosphopentomutase [Verrucomicrobiae bacterium]